VTSETRLAEIVTALEVVDISCLIMGGHAVRYYGLERNTVDFDLHLAPECWPDLPDRLRRSPLLARLPVVEGPTWRPRDFRRFRIGQLPDGREEWLEFWRENHLLPPYAELQARCERGRYGGRTMPFLALPDLIRSKETERQSDWQDIAVLEEFLDARSLAGAAQSAAALVPALAELRSRRGFETAWQRGHFADRETARQALTQTRLSITQAFLLPFAADCNLQTPAVPIEPVVEQRLRAVAAGSPLHLALVEVVRRQYKAARQHRDRADKEATRRSQA
jgi:hypothetical protein